MCKTTKHGGGAGGGRGGDRGGHGCRGGCCLCSRRAKRQKVPKRGSGVAELEKLLRDQEKKRDFSNNSSLSVINLSPSGPSSKTNPDPKHSGTGKSFLSKTWMPSETNGGEDEGVRHLFPCPGKWKEMLKAQPQKGFI